MVEVSPAPARDPDVSGGRTATSVSDALRTRRSVRAFRPTPVPLRVVEQLVGAAALSASNSNVQPWRVHVVLGEAKRRLAEALWEALDHEEREVQPGYEYQPEPEAWPEPFRTRRTEFGQQLYQQTLGVDRADSAGRARHHRRNYEFFGAPVGLVLTVSAHPLDSALIDAGMFLQALMLSAREHGLDTCPQASFVDFHAVLRRHLGIADDEIVVCGVALGHADPRDPLNALTTPREPLSDVVTVHGEPGAGAPCPGPAGPSGS
ncbi:nitroreductase [Rhodococcus aerolatus]